MPFTDAELKQTALVGLRHERERIDGLIAELEREVGGSGRNSRGAPAKRRPMSAATRKRMAEAQRKRWAVQRDGAPASAKKPAAAKKRRIGAEGRRRIIEATRKRWEAYRKAKAANEGSVGKKAKAANEGGAGKKPKRAATKQEPETPAA